LEHLQLLRISAACANTPLELALKGVGNALKSDNEAEFHSFNCSGNSCIFIKAATVNRETEIGLVNKEVLFRDRQTNPMCESRRQPGWPPCASLTPTPCALPPQPARANCVRVESKLQRLVALQAIQK